MSDGRVFYDYRILGIAPEVPEGHEFRSHVPDLDEHPELWDAECPFTIPNRARADVRVVKE